MAEPGVLDGGAAGRGVAEGVEVRRGGESLLDGLARGRLDVEVGGVPQAGRERRGVEDEAAAGAALDESPQDDERRAAPVGRGHGPARPEFPDGFGAGGERPGKDRDEEEGQPRRGPYGGRPRPSPRAASRVDHFGRRRITGAAGRVNGPPGRS